MEKSVIMYSSYQDHRLAFDPVYFEIPCPLCGGYVYEADGGTFVCDDCDWEVEGP